MRTRLALTILLTLALTTAALGQNYGFSVPKMVLNVTPNADASVTLDYEIEFRCQEGRSPIDIVDIGLPDKKYDISNMSASVDGQPVAGIRKSTYIDIGVEVPLGAAAIQPGQTGRFTFQCTMPKRVYGDTTNKEMASLWITPTWFDGSILSGTTALYVFVNLPKDFTDEEVVHQGEPFSRKFRTDSYLVAAWEFPGTRVDGEHMCELSFPRRGMTGIVKMTVLKIFYKWWLESEGVRIGFAIFVLVLYGIAFFRASSGTGCSVFVPLLVGMGALFYFAPWTELLALPALVPLWFLAEKALKKRKGKYLPAIASVEGGGIKRGLAAPEAAIILELPLGRVLTLVIFGMLKKGIVTEIDDEPLEVKVSPEYAGLARGERRKKAREIGTVLRGYEQAFIEEIESHPGHPLRQIDFNDAVKAAITGTAKRLKGFDLERTQAYYRYIVNRAWAEAKALGDVEKRTAHCDDNLLWLLAADDGIDNFHFWHRGGYHYHTPWFRSSHGGGMTIPRADTSAGSTSLGDVSKSFAGWTEGLAGGLAGKIDPGSMGLKADGLMDLSGVDKITMDTLSSLAESSGGGGGGGGCACAGCACACACAGGGR